MVNPLPLADPCAFRFALSLRWHGRVPQLTAASCAGDFDQRIQAARRWVAADTATKSAQTLSIPLPSDIARQSIQELYRVDFDLRQAMPRKALATAWLDVYCLETGVAQITEQAAPDIFRTLRAQVDQLPPPAAAESQIGTGWCFWMELSAAEWQQATPETIKQLATETWKHWGGAAEPTLYVCRLDFAYWVTDMAAAEPVSFLIVPRGHHAQAVDLLHVYLPRLLAAWFKGQKLSRVHELAVRQMHEREEALVRRVKESTAAKSALAQLEQAALQISTAQLAISEQLSGGEERSHTLKLNVENAERILRLPPLRQHEAELAAVWVEPLRLLAEQSAADLGYWRNTETLAQRHLALLQFRAQTIYGIWQRRMTIIFGLFVVLGIPQFFPELTDKAQPYFTWRWRLLWFFLSVVLLWTALWLAGRRTQKHP